jgi:adenylate cyclase class 2
VFEIELKFPLLDPASLRQRLHTRGAVASAVVVEVDHYHNAPDRDFASTGEAVRVRQHGSQCFFTYKGKKQPGPVKTREELELPLEPGVTADTATKFLQHLGYKSVAVVRKQRQSYSLEHAGFSLTVCIDEVAELGTFVELEILSDDIRKTEAQAVLLTLADEWQLGAIEPRSYLRMTLEHADRG